MPPYDLFISYAHRDDRGNPGDDYACVKAIKASIEREYAAMTGGQGVRIFLDDVAICTGHDWREVILRGLQSSKMMLAFVSENYFQSAYCHEEWKHFVNTASVGANSATSTARLATGMPPAPTSRKPWRSVASWWPPAPPTPTSSATWR